jgi:NitT/TauT family transport system substrate-binding protein
MENHKANRWSRRKFLSAAALAGTGAIFGLRSEAIAAEQPPETTRIRLPRFPSFDVACVAPQWMAEELLLAEGFTRVEYVPFEGELDLLASGKQDIMIYDAPGLILALDEGKPIVVLAGIHSGCFELIGTEQVRSVLALRGRRVAVATSGRQAFVAAMASYVGLVPRKDITFVLTPEAKQLFIGGKVDAILGFPPEPQELRAKKIGRTVVNTALDRPWSQYFCCFAAANRNFVRKHPIATKRTLRALIIATDICAAEPERVARQLVDRGYLKDYDYSLQAMREVPYGRWREYDSADTLRFLALRLHEARMIKSSPQKLIGEGTDWRFVTELKRELKG